MKTGLLGMLAGLTWASFAGAATQGPGVVVAEVSLPSVAAAYHGGTHVFLDGRARLTCSSHGGFTSSVDPPRRPGATATADYFATFTGELALDPPLVPSAVVLPIVERAHMVERITLVERREGSQVLDTEMLALDLRGAGMPASVMVRESPARRSFGRTTITILPRGRYRIDAFFDVWLDMSLDGGRSWHRAEAPVRMSLAPVAAGREEDRE